MGKKENYSYNTMIGWQNLLYIEFGIDIVRILTLKE